LVCIDKFKDTMRAQVASSVIEQTLIGKAKLNSVELQVTKIPISDGGEGFLECIQMALKSA